MSDLTIDATRISDLARRNHFIPSPGRLIFFGIRGALPHDLSGTGFANAHALRMTDINHYYMRCTIGQLDTSNDRLAVFPGSTVPHMRYVEKALQKNGRGANMLMLGHYAYRKGDHRPSSASGHRAFRQASFFPVWRSRDDRDYDLDDVIDNDGDFVWDNLHCAYNDNVNMPKFGSAGCQVVAGRQEMPRGTGNELGPWKTFVSHAYGTRGQQDRYSYYLFSAAEVLLLEDRPASQISTNLRFGSSGDLVAEAQARLIVEGFPLDTPDSEFGRNTLDCVIGFQERTFGRGNADGIVGPNTARALGLELPRLSQV